MFAQTSGAREKIPQTDPAFQQCISPACKATYSIDEVRVACRQCGDLLAALSERQYIVLLNFGQTDWGDIERICRTYPGISLVLTRIGYRQFRPLFALWKRCANLYCDLSGFTTYLGVEETLGHFGSERLLFGTGLPVCDPGGPIARLSYTDAPQADIEAMAHGNLERLLARVQLGEGGGQ